MTKRVEEDSNGGRRDQAKHEDVSKAETPGDEGDKTVEPQHDGRLSASLPSAELTRDTPAPQTPSHIDGSVLREIMSVDSFRRKVISRIVRRLRG